MKYDEIFENIRALNIRALASAAIEHAPCHVEGAFRDDDGKVIVDGPFDLPCRVDIVPMDDEENLLESVMVNPSTTFAFEEFEAFAGGVPFKINPFGWDNAQFRVAFPSAPAVAPIVAWFLRWFDGEDENEVGPDGLNRVVHYLSDPEYADGTLAFVVDFGSAPVAALEDLVGVLVGLGATCIVVTAEEISSIH